MAWQPRVSFLVTCHDLGRFLPEALESIFAQTYQDFEVVIVDDGSTDPETLRILEHLRRPRTQLVTIPNRGLPAARNEALRHARGRYLCAFDCDDVLQPRFLERTLAVLDRDPSVAFVSTWLEVFGTESWIWRQERVDFPLLLSECVVLTAAPVRREAVEAVGGYDAETFRDGDEDWDLWIGLVEGGYRGAVVPEVLFRYRRRPDSMFARCNRGQTRRRLRRALIEKHRASFAEHAADVLLLRERECGEHLRSNASLELEIGTILEPALERVRRATAALAPVEGPGA